MGQRRLFGRSPVSVMRRGGEVDTIFGFEKEADALPWIEEKSQAWSLERATKQGSPHSDCFIASIASETHQQPP